MATPRRLYYFHGRGRSQQARWVLAAAEVPFENVCLSTPDEFQALCTDGKLTYDQIPMLEDGDLRITQSMAIVRHAARLGNIHGSSSLVDGSRIDEVLEGITDARAPLIGYPFTDPQEAGQRLAGSVQRFFPSFERLIAKNNHAPFVVGSSLSSADVLLAELYHSSMEAFTTSFNAQTAQQVLEPYALMKASHDHVLALPSIQAFIQGPNWFPFPAGATKDAYVRNVRTVLR